MLRSRPNVSLPTQDNEAGSSSSSVEKGSNAANANNNGVIKKRRTRRTRGGTKKSTSTINGGAFVIGILISILIVYCVYVLIGSPNAKPNAKSSFHNRGNTHIMEKEANLRKVELEKRHERNQDDKHHDRLNTLSHSIYDLQYPSIDGDLIKLSAFAGHAALVINVASE